MKEFLVASASEILSGSVTDAYFERTEEILSKAGKNPEVVMELHVKQFPSPDYGFGVLAGTYEVMKLLEGLPVTVEAMEDYAWSAREITVPPANPDSLFVGTPGQVASGLRALAARLGADEVMVSPVAGAHAGDAPDRGKRREQSLELLAQELL